MAVQKVSPRIYSGPILTRSGKLPVRKHDSTLSDTFAPYADVSTSIAVTPYLGFVT